MNKQDKPQISIRSYELGDENTIVDFLNFSFSEKVTDLNKWNWMHIDYPMFKKDNVFIVEANGKMVGYRELLLRYLCISGSRLTTASLLEYAAASREKPTFLLSKSAQNSDRASSGGKTVGRIRL